ncbi:MAG TPA: hypothetical protein VD814_08360, partial [Nocardioides sp.]|nr:hypothetical protein [Nocardioides sp.]
MTEDALTGLAQLARARTERDGLLAQLEVTRTRRDAARERLAQARSRLDDEQADVAALESMSMTRILAGLRGSRSADLDREQAEAAAARYAVAEAEARLAVEEREIASLEQRVAEHGDLDARRAELLAQREREVRDDPRSAATVARLEELAERLGVLQAESAQLAEADAAGRRAHEALHQAAQHLGSAGSWATYDTFFGGGLVADMVKHDRLDRAGALMQEADAALARLAGELADVGVGAVGGVGVTDFTRALDVWFDNIFSDWAVRDRIERAQR